jgi:catechol 2,3-dioxygenase-like lactoylglutathione lyase family enzyme
MLSTTKLMAFVATTNAARAKTFYGDVLGLRSVSDDEYAVLFDAGGTTLRVQKVKDVTPPPYTTLGWEVTDIAAAITGLVARGVEFLRFGFFEQDELGAWTAPDGSKVAWFKDPEGHTLSLTELAR